MTFEATRINELFVHNHTSFQLWRKENLVNYQKVSNSYEHDFLQKFFLLYMFFLTVLIVKLSNKLSSKSNLKVSGAC